MVLFCHNCLSNVIAQSWITISSKIVFNYIMHDVFFDFVSLYDNPISFLRLYSIQRYPVSKTVATKHCKLCCIKYMWDWPVTMHSFLKRSLHFFLVETFLTWSATMPPTAALLQTSNGSWCMGIKGEMSGTVCVTFTWYMYIYELFIAFVCFVVCSLL